MRVLPISLRSCLDKNPRRNNKQLKKYLHLKDRSGDNEKMVPRMVNYLDSRSTCYVKLVLTSMTSADIAEVVS